VENEDESSSDSSSSVSTSDSEEDSEEDDDPALDDDSTDSESDDTEQPSLIDMLSRPTKPLPKRARPEIVVLSSTSNPDQAEEHVT
jgi:DNA-directed RNA polymerase specialized sigma subunit